MTKNRIKIQLNPQPQPVVKRIFNPLDHVSLASGDDNTDVRMTSLSRMENEQVGVCPKCNKPMGTAIIENDDTVFYCETDRVATPMPNR